MFIKEINSIAAATFFVFFGFISSRRQTPRRHHWRLSLRPLARQIRVAHPPRPPAAASAH